MLWLLSLLFETVILFMLLLYWNKGFENVRRSEEQSTLNYFDEVNFYFVFTYLTYEIEIVCLILLKYLTSLIKIIYLLICFWELLNVRELINLNS
jgi:hypothetical protein